jgi:hypothetical protein
MMLNTFYLFFEHRQVKRLTKQFSRKKSMKSRYGIANIDLPARSAQKLDSTENIKRTRKEVCPRT